MVGENPSGLAFDASNIWVVNSGSNTVTKIKTSEGKIIGTDAVTSIFLQLELNGVSKVGSNPLDVLKQNISGYSRLNPQSSTPVDYLPTR